MLAWIPKRLIMEKADCEGKQELPGLVPAGLGGNWRQLGATAFDSDPLRFYTGEGPSGLLCIMHSVPSPS